MEQKIRSQDHNWFGDRSTYTAKWEYGLRAGHLVQQKHPIALLWLDDPVSRSLSLVYFEDDSQLIFLGFCDFIFNLLSLCPGVVRHHFSSSSSIPTLFFTSSNHNHFSILCRCVYPIWRLLEVTFTSWIIPQVGLRSHRFHDKADHRRDSSITLQALKEVH